MMYMIGQIIIINQQKFEIAKVEEIFPGTFELSGTKEGDPSFLSGKRTVFSNQLTSTSTGYFYDWNAR